MANTMDARKAAPPPEPDPEVRAAVHAVLASVDEQFGALYESDYRAAIRLLIEELRRR